MDATERKIIADLLADQIANGRVTMKVYTLHNNGHPIITTAPPKSATIIPLDFTKGRKRKRRRSSPASVHQLTLNLGDENNV